MSDIKRKRIDFAAPRAWEQRKARCRSCNAQIVMLGRQPLHIGSALEVEGEVRMESHFAHCPYAGRHRRPRARKQSSRERAAAERAASLRAAESPVEPLSRPAAQLGLYRE